MRFVNNTKEWIMNVAPNATIDCPTLPKYEIVTDENGNKEKKLIECYPNPEWIDKYEAAGLTLFMEGDVIEWEIIE